MIFVVGGDLASAAADAVVRPATTTLDLSDPQDQETFTARLGQG